MNNIITLTNDALNFIKNSVTAEDGCLGVRVNIAVGGCQGMAYEMTFVNEVNPSDILIQKDDIKIYIASRAVIFVSGMQVDYVKNAMGGNIVFENPNAKSKCGCGKSFSTNEQDKKCANKCC